jgi:hypothetical protein
LSAAAVVFWGSWLAFFFLPRAEGSVGRGDTCKTADVS